MKTIIRTILSLGLLFFLVCGGSLLYTSRASGEMAGILDQLNPLVSESELYVKTQKPISIDQYGSGQYKQLAASKDGQTRTIEFQGLKVLKENRYLKLTNKGAHVESFEEIAKDEVPKAALEAID